MVLVTGGTGLLGSHLVLNLLQSGKRVRALSRKNSDKGRIEKTASYYNISTDGLLENLEWVEADILDLVDLNDVFTDVEEVYHCAAKVSFDPRDAQKMLEDNPKGTANVVNLSLEHKVKKLVYVSSVASLGRKSENEYITEDSDWVESKNNSNYAKSKYRAELEVWRAVQEGLNAVIVNPCIILGPGGWKQGSSGLFHTIANGFKYYTLGTNAYVDVRDVVKAMTLLMASPIKQDRFIIAGENLSYKKFFEYVAAGFEVAAPSKKVSAALSNFLWRLERVRTALFGGKPFITKETAHTAQKTYYYDNSKVKKALDFEFIRIEDSVKEICSFYQKDNA